MWSHLLVALVLVGFGAPWTFLLYRRSSDATLEGLLDRINLGYAISFSTLFVASQLRLWLFVPIWVAGVLVGAVDALRRSDRRHPPLELETEGKIVLGSAALYLVLRCLPFLARELPIGWDAYFHMTISESIFVRGRAVHDWMPYEDIPLNYPIGAHLLMALTQWLTGVRPHRFFELMVVLFTLLSGLQIFSLTARAARDRRVGCYATLAYLFLANMGSLQYALWSGLPNLIGMYLFLGLLTAIVIDEGSRARFTAIFVSYFLAACFVHHHVMVTAGLCLAWTAAWLFFVGDRVRAKRIAIGLIASGLIGAPYFLMYLVRSLTLNKTGIGNFLEGVVDPLNVVKDMGPGFSLAVWAGVYLFFKNKEHVSTVLLQSLVAMLSVWITLEFVVHTGSLVLFEREVAPFTPSRFVTDAVTLLSVFAGILFRTMQGSGETNRGPIVVMIVAGFLVLNRAPYRDTFNQEVPKERLETYEWIREHADADAMLLDPDLHATYLTRRMSSGFPLPTSEYRALAANRHMLEAMAAGKKRPKQLRRQILAVVAPGRAAPGGKLLWEHPSGFRVVETFAPKHSSP